MGQTHTFFCDNCKKEVKHLRELVQVSLQVKSYHSAAPLTSKAIDLCNECQAKFNVYNWSEAMRQDRMKAEEKHLPQPTLEELIRELFTEIIKEEIEACQV